MSAAEVPEAATGALRLVRSIWAENADRAASRPEEYAAQERRAAVREAVGHLVNGHPGRAQYVMARSLMRQARIHGVGHTNIPPACPCGGRGPACGGAS